MTNQEQYNELAYYTLAHKSLDFIHQNIVDAYTAQTANEKTKPITIVYALAGLYLYIIKGFTGKQVQLAHVTMSKGSKVFEEIILPESRGKITAKDVLETPPGTERDQMIHQWCISVWEAYSSEHNKIISITVNLLQKENGH
jgi:uncharacterized membrane protein YcgQ (UPF0703/DUF1980 family)